MQMGQKLLALLGGDGREIILAKFLVDQGFAVHLCGFENYRPLPAPNFANPVEAVQGTAAVILPMAGIREDLTPPSPYSANPPRITEAVFAALPPGVPVFVGRANAALKRMARSVNLIEIADDDELAILNSIPTAEGALELAMAHTDFTLHGSRVLVAGLGRCGLTLARMLRGIGAEVTAAARNPADLARAYEMGLTICPFTRLRDCVADVDLIFNTVPAPVITGSILEAAKRCRLVVDIASGRGGTDFARAEELGIKAILAPGLPGKAAPATAGKVLTQVYPRLLRQYGLMEDEKNEK